MTHLYLEGKEIALPEDISFQYNVENPVISESEGYTMSIEIPLFAGNNLSVFGFIYRMDADIDKVRFNANLVSHQFCASGVAAIVGVSEKSVKIQFLQGKSAQNFISRLDDTYINELKLDTPDFQYSAAKANPLQVFKSLDDGNQGVPLPWVISDSGETVHNCLVKESSTGALRWHPDIKTLSYMPYLIVVAKAICTAIGYSFDFSQWENSPKRFIIMCNAMPESLALKNLAYPLPHWTVSEFFDKLEFILDGKFTIDSYSKSISFATLGNVLQKSGIHQVEKVIDDFSADLELEPEKQSRPAFLKNRGYDDNSGRFWPVRCADWYIRKRMSPLDEEESTPAQPQDPYRGGARGRVGARPGWYYDTMRDTTNEYKNIHRFDTMDELIEYADKFKYSNNLPGAESDALLYAKDCNCFFCLHAVEIVQYQDIPAQYKSKYGILDDGIYYFNELIPVNDFGDYILDDRDDADTESLDVVPVDIDFAQGLNCFLPFSEQSSSDDSGLHQPKTFALIKEGKKSCPEYYSKLYIAFWTGIRDSWQDASLFPLTSNVTIYKGWKYEFSPEGCNLRLNNGYIYAGDDIINADVTKTYKISFLSDSIPEISSVFLIRGKRYLCKKLTVEFNSTGMNNLIKGEFYRL